MILYTELYICTVVIVFIFVNCNMVCFDQSEVSPASSRSAQVEANDSSSILDSPVLCSSDEGNHVSSLPEPIEPHTATKPEICRLPDDIEDGLDDADNDIQLDISDVSKEDLLQLHSKVSEQKNSYHRKCVQVGKLIELN